MIKIGRIQKLQEKVKSEGLDGFLVTFEPDLVYLTQLAMEGYWVAVTGSNWWVITNRLLDGAFRDMGVKESNLRLRMNFKEEIKALINDFKLKDFCFDSEGVSFSLGKEFEAMGMGIRPKFLASLRIAKDKEELKFLRASCRITAQSMAFIASQLKPGVPERQLAYQIERFMREKGAEKTSFDLIVGGGPNSAVPHHRTGQRRLKNGDAVVVDIGCVYKNYCSDMTRTFFVGKSKSDLFKKVYSIVAASQHAGINKIKSGLEGKDIDNACRELIAKEGYGEAFTHGTGHGVGIEIHEPPWLRAKSENLLGPGMIVTVEPGIYLDGKLGVRIEDTLLVTQNGAEILTKV